MRHHASPSSSRLVIVDHDGLDRPTALVTRVRVRGPWTDAVAAVVIREIHEHARHGETIVVDLRACPNANTAQLAVLIACLRQARAAKAVMLVNGSPQLYRLATVCRVDRMLRWAS